MLGGDIAFAASLDGAKDDFGKAVQMIAEKTISKLNETVDRGEFVLSIHYARAYLMLREDEKAFHWLTKAVDERNVFPLLMNSDPFYDRIRADSRFQKMLISIGLCPPID